MQEYVRQYPLFSLCGLNCALCPRFNTEGTSRCPGCGGADFHLKHPACAVITCNRKRDNVEYCFQCSAYPCAKYEEPSGLDSFISYRKVLSDFEKASGEGLEKYAEELCEKAEILEFLLNACNDGRRKSFYCTAVNLLELEDLREICKEIRGRINGQDIDAKDKVALIVSLFEDKAKQKNISFKLRKKGE